MKNFCLFSAFFCLATASILTSCGGGGSSGTSSGIGGGGTSPSTSAVVVPGIGTGGSTYIFGTLDGTWTSGCEGGANGDNWSYMRTMTISGNSVTQNTSMYRQNQTCSGTVDVTENITFTMAWGSYDTTGFSNNATYSDFSWLITPKTSYGLARLGNKGSCLSNSFTLNIASECRTSITGSYKYYLADNVFLPVGSGPQNFSTSLGILYAFGTYRKVVTNGSAFDGIYAFSDVPTYTKLIISGDRFAYISAESVDSESVFIASGSISPGPVISMPSGASSFVLTTKSKIYQPRLASGATNLNSAAVCGFTDFANGVVKNLLLSGTCTSSPTHAIFKLTGGAMQFSFSNLPLPTTFSGPTLYAPWVY